MGRLNGSKGVTFQWGEMKVALSGTLPLLLKGSTRWGSCRYLESCRNPPVILAFADFHSSLHDKEKRPRS